MQKILELENGYYWTLESGRIYDYLDTFSTIGMDINLYTKRTFLVCYTNDNRKIILSIYDSVDKSLNDVIYYDYSMNDIHDFPQRVVDFLLNTDMIDIINTDGHFDISTMSDDTRSRLFGYKISYSFNRNMIYHYYKRDNYDGIEEIINNGYNKKIHKTTHSAYPSNNLAYNDATFDRLIRRCTNNKILPYCFDMFHVILHSTFGVFEKICDICDFNKEEYETLLKYSIYLNKGKVTKYILGKIDIKDISNTHDIIGCVIDNCYQGTTYDDVNVIRNDKQIDNIKKLFGKFDATDDILNNMNFITPVALFEKLSNHIDETRYIELLDKAIEVGNNVGAIQYLIDKCISIGTTHPIDISRMMYNLILYRRGIFIKQENHFNINCEQILDILNKLKCLGYYDESIIALCFNESIKLVYPDVMRLLIKDFGATTNMIDYDDKRIKVILNRENDVREILIWQNV